MASSSELLARAEAVAGTARPGEQIEAYVARSRETEVRVFDAEVESQSVAVSEGIGVRVVANGNRAGAGGRLGFAWAGSLDDAIIASTLDDARDNATLAEPDEWCALGQPSEITGDVPTLPGLWREELRGVPVTDKVDLALAVERATRAADPRVRAVEVAVYGDSATEVAVASSTGVATTSARTLCSVSVVALAGDADETQTGYGFSAGRAFSELDVEMAAADASERAIRLLGARQPNTRRLPVVLDPLVTRSFLALVGAALAGEAVLKRRSMFAGRPVGDPLAGPGVTLVDDPTVAESFGAARYDSEGVPTRRTPLIERGGLAGFLHNVATGRRAGTGTTGSAVRGFSALPDVGARALHLVPGDRPPSALLAAVPQALYVQSVSGLHSGANPVSGDFSVGVEGLLVRDGEFAEPVREATVASTLPRMLLDIVEVADDLTWLPGGAAGATILVADMQMSGA
jgi:PmbA protein